MAHENEYDNNMITMLELIWGEGYMAPGGPGNVTKLLDGLETRAKRILDIGCGIGGPAFEMARTFNAEVVGIDLEAPLIERAIIAAERKGLSNRCTFETVDPGPLTFADKSFDIIVSSGAITQTTDHAAILGECCRVLRPGGYLTCYEWMKSPQPYSDDMSYWFKMEGLTYALKTLDGYATEARKSGFVDIETEDASAWYRRRANIEYGLICGDLYPRMLELLGQQAADHFVEDWRAMVTVCNSGELRQGYFRGRRPAGLSS